MVFRRQRPKRQSIRASDETLSEAIDSALFSLGGDLVKVERQKTRVLSGLFNLSTLTSFYAAHKLWSSLATRNSL